MLQVFGQEYCQYLRQKSVIKMRIWPLCSNGCKFLVAVHAVIKTCACWVNHIEDLWSRCPNLAPFTSSFLVSTRFHLVYFVSKKDSVECTFFIRPRIYGSAAWLRIQNMHWYIHIHSVTIKFLNWRYYSNTTNTIYCGWTGLVRTFMCMMCKFSACLVYAYEDYSCFGEVSFSIMLKVSEWNKEQQLSFVKN
jgi:hypothetical protein